MTERDARELARRLLGTAPLFGAHRQEPRASLADAIAREAEGHPLFIDELVRHALMADAPTPGGVRLEDALLGRARRLDPTLRKLVELVSVAGGPITQQLAQAVLGLELGPFARAVRTLSVANLVRTTGSRRHGTIEPFHDRVRDSISQSLSEAERREWHRRIATEMEKDGTSPAPPGRGPHQPEDFEVEALAAHWRSAGMPEKAAGYALLAAERAAAAFAFDRAAHLYRVALSLGVSTQAASRKLGDALAYAGRGAEAAAAYLGGVESAQSDEALDLRRLAAEQLLVSGHLDEGLAVLKSVLAAMGMEVPETTPSALLSLGLRRAQLRMRGATYVPRREDEVPETTLRRIDSLATIAMGLGMVDTLRGADFQTRHLLLALDAGEPNRVARALSMEAAFVATGGTRSLARASRVIELAQQSAARTNHPLTSAWVLGGEAATNFLAGRWGRALDLFQRSAEILRERCAGVQWELDSSNFYQLGCLVHLGELRELGRRIPRLLEEAEQRGDRYALTHLRTGVVTIAWLARGDASGARLVAEDAISRWSQRGTHLPHFLDVLAQAQIDLYEGKAHAAYARIEERYPRLERAMLLRVQFIRIKMLELRARAALALAVKGDDEERHLAQASRAARAIEREGAPWAMPLAKLVRGSALARRGELEQARLAWQAAAREAESEEMALHAACARWRAAEVDARAGAAESFAHARNWLLEQGVADPARLVEMLAPLRDMGSP